MMPYIEKINKNAVKICETLQQAGFDAYIVGGCVRDLILNITPHDWDIATNAKPDDVKVIFPKHYPTGEKHGTITVPLNDEMFEITTFRVDGVYSDGRRPDNVEFSAKIEDDLARRDFTMNAIAYNPINDKLVDPFDGVIDANDGVVRAVGNPVDRFNEDGLRIMRAARFVSRFDCGLDWNTRQAMKSCVDMLDKVSKERIKDEIWKILESKCPSEGLSYLWECGALEKIFYEWKSTAGFNGYLIKEAIYLVDECDNAEIETKVALLCHWFTEDIISDFGKELKLSHKEYKKIKFILDAIAEYDDLFDHATSVFGIRRFIAWIKNNAPDGDPEKSFDNFCAFAKTLGHEVGFFFDSYTPVYSRKELAINGDDALALGYVGKEIKTILDDCYQHILLNPGNNTRERLLEFAQRK